MVEGCLGARQRKQRVKVGVERDADTLLTARAIQNFRVCGS